MGSAMVDAQEYWGYLINSDKTPAPLLEQLLLGIANYINRNVAPWDVPCLTPSKLASFYRLVGGNYDALFLEPPHESLSYIYRSLGCYHSLEPEKNPFVAPSIPALTAQGFVRWQIIQLLLDPPLHVPLLQEALKRFEITNPGEGGPFPRILPASSLPSRADREMSKWHEDALEKLVPNSGLQEERQAAKEVESLADSSVDESSIVDAGDYFQPRHERGSSTSQPRHERGSSTSRPRFVPISPKSRRPDKGQSNERPSHRESRRRSHPDEYTDPDDPWHGEGATPTGFTKPNSRRASRQRAPSMLSITSSSDAADVESFSNSEASKSHVRPRKDAGLYPSIDHHGRRHSAHNPYVFHNDEFAQRQNHSHSLSPPFYAHQRPHTQGGLSQENPDSRTQSVRWQDMNGLPDRSYDMPDHFGGRPSVRFDNADQAFREERIRRRSMETVGGMSGQRYR